MLTYTIMTGTLTSMKTRNNGERTSVRPKTVGLPHDLHTRIKIDVALSGPGSGIQEWVIEACEAKLARKQVVPFRGRKTGLA